MTDPKPLMSKADAEALLAVPLRPGVNPADIMEALLVTSGLEPAPDAAEHIQEWRDYLNEQVSADAP